MCVHVCVYVREYVRGGVPVKARAFTSACDETKAIYDTSKMTPAVNFTYIILYKLKYRQQAIQ